MGRAFLTGWSLPPKFFTQYKSDTVIDSTLLVENLISDSTLNNNGDQTLLELCDSQLKECSEIIGFSMGAMLALQIAQLRSFSKVTLIAPTFSFVQTKEQPLGISPRVLQQMIRALQTKPDQVLEQFDRNCGVANPVTRNYSTSTLTAGLQFLKQVTIPNKELQGNPELIIRHAKDDTIVPIDAGKLVAQRYNVPIIEFTGGHVSSL